MNKKKDRDCDNSPYTTAITDGTKFAEELRKKTTHRADGTMLRPPPLRLKERIIVVSNDIDFNYGKS